MNQKPNDYVEAIAAVDEIEDFEAIFEKQYSVEPHHEGENAFCIVKHDLNADGERDPDQSKVLVIGPQPMMQNFWEMARDIFIDGFSQGVLQADEDPNLEELAEVIAEMSDEHKEALVKSYNASAPDYDLEPISVSDLDSLEDFTPDGLICLDEAFSDLIDTEGFDENTDDDEEECAGDCKHCASGTAVPDDEGDWAEEGDFEPSYGSGQGVPVPSALPERRSFVLDIPDGDFDKIKAIMEDLSLDYTMQPMQLLEQKSNFVLVSEVNKAFGNPQGDPHNVDIPRVARQYSNIADELAELFNALGGSEDRLKAASAMFKASLMESLNDGQPFKLEKLRDSSADIKVFAYGGDHFVGVNGDLDMQAVCESLFSRFLKDEADKEASVAKHAAAGITDVYFEGEFPRMVLKSAADQPDAPKGKFLKSASTAQPIFYEV